MTRKTTKLLSASEQHAWDKASQLIDSGHYLESLKLLDHLLEVARDEPKLYAHRGYVLYRLDRFDAAIKDFNAALNIKPSAANTLFLRGRCHEEIEAFEAAIKDYKRVIELKPDTADAYAQMGFCFENLGHLNEAKDAYEHALKYDPKESLALAGLKELDKNAQKNAS